MKVAIIGAGIAGLSCAIVLEKYGIYPTIYEKLGTIGDPEEHIGAILHIIDRPIGDGLQFVKQRFGIHITPVNPIRKITHIGPTVETSVMDFFGYFTGRGRAKESLKGQLYSQLQKPNVLLNTPADYLALSKEYDCVVVADGLMDTPSELGFWKQRVRGYIRGVNVEGNFDPYELKMWLHRDYLKNGYAYLTPFNETKATIAAFIPESNERCMDFYWEQFVDKANLAYNVLETFKVNHTSGLVTKHQTGNVYFAGIAGGAIDSFLGFGQINSIIMGASIGEGIAQNCSKLAEIEMLQKKLKRLHELRLSFNHWTNQTYDTILWLMKFWVVQKLGYDNPFNVIHIGAALAHLEGKLSGKKDMK